MPTALAQFGDVIPSLLDVAPGFVCRILTDHTSQVRYRVPVEHRTFTHFMTDGPDAASGVRALASLPDSPTVEQLRRLLSGGQGVGMWVTSRLAAAAGFEEGTTELQASTGSILIFPPHEWDTIKEELKEWFFDGVEAGFKGLPYTFDDIVPFAGINFSPDCWFLVVRGSMAGKIFWWTHDGDSVMEEPWADDLAAWGQRVCREVPGVFGGVIRFHAADSIDSAPPGTRLYPTEYVSNLKARE
jgi:hypothetical protein